MSLKFIQTRVNLAIVESASTFSDRLEHQRLWIERRINTKDIEHNTGCGAVVPASSNVPVTDEEDKLTLVVIIERCKGVDGATKRLLSFSIARYLTENKLVLQFWVALGTELEGGKD